MDITLILDTIQSICNDDSKQNNVIELLLDLLTIIGYSCVVMVAAYKFCKAKHPVVRRYYLSTGFVFALCAVCGYLSDILSVFYWYLPIQLILHILLVISVFYLVYYKLTLRVEA